jgi:plastocyanin domain-containing protein
MRPTRFLLPCTAALALAVAARGRAADAAPAEGTLKDGVRTVEMAVTENGFEPDKLKVSKGEKVRLVVTRKTENTCATEIVIEDQPGSTELPLGKAVAVEFTPKRSGQLRYACGMGHVGGVIFVK